MTASQPGPASYENPYQPLPQSQAYGESQGQASAPAPTGYQPAPEQTFQVQDQTPGQAMATYEPYQPYEPYQVYSDPTYQTSAAQPYPPSYGYQPFMAPYVRDDPGKNLGLAGLLISALGWMFPYLGFLAPIVGLILSIVAYQKSKTFGRRNGVAIAGIVVSSVIMALGLLMIVGLVIFTMGAR